MIEKLKSRIVELEKIVEQSVSQHNAIIGRLAEAKEWVKFLETEDKKTAEDNAEEEVKHVEVEVV